MTRRLVVLLSALLALALLRLAWWRDAGGLSVVPAVRSNVQAHTGRSATIPAAIGTPSLSAQSMPRQAASRDWMPTVEETPIPNIFVSRRPGLVQMPPAQALVSPPPPPPIQGAVAPPVGPAPNTVSEPPLPAKLPVPFQLIGSWKDEGGARIFLSGPVGTIQAQEGDTLTGGYFVHEIGSQKVTLIHLTTRHQIVLDSSAIGQPIAFTRKSTGTP